MARKTIEQRLAQLDAQRKQLQARLGSQERARDTRRKVLIGALVLHRLENNADDVFNRQLSKWLGDQLPGFLTREDDRKLFPDLIAGIVEKSGMPEQIEKSTEVAQAN